MYSFKEYISHEKIDKSEFFFETLYNILAKFSKKQQIEFVLFCVKEAYYLRSNPQSKECIDLIEKWLKDPKSVSRQELINSNTWSNPPDHDAIHAVLADGHNCCHFCSAAADKNACASNNYKQTMERYIQIASSYLSKSDLKDDKIQNFLQDPESLAILFDYLEDRGEDLVIKRNNRFILNIPGHQNIIALNNIDLAKQVLEPKNRWILDYLKRLYS